ncbi:kazal-type serine protease inhibitor domain-containing protein 1-like protein [Lates japonicus]|uniref:Kazal-type serine protease inhibitor domain-containing protein 1-like protein n=1 Tax=Lates japonicus TaxID=270547 RepID=A0AAD3MLX0_LATJO|nr:kazal-type serine protease inhibitor domain-containing protein 1-like protein [Lates japonicus]
MWLHTSLGLPPQHRGWLRLWEEGEGCGDCNQHLCPLLPDDCPAGRVLDDCGCCEQCANVEGQQCDPDGAQKFYGQCGEGMVCQRKIPKREHRAEPEPTSPRILQGPRNLSNYTGNDIVFACEVSAYPLPNLNWRKKGRENFLPGDDPHISVQARGGPQRYTVSTWLQIHSLLISDEGVYSCISRNALGETSASAQLTVLRQGESLSVTVKCSQHPPLPPSNTQIHASYPHQLPLTPHHSPASACHVLGVKGIPPIAHQNGTPPSPAPRTKSQSIAWETEMDWDIHDPVTFREAPALQRAAVTDN